jgi:hypothetical protein
MKVIVKTFWNCTKKAGKPPTWWKWYGARIACIGGVIRKEYIQARTPGNGIFARKTKK